jgi:hypothetical protein
MWVRCGSCDEMARADQSDDCSCGTELPPAPRWW